MQATWLETVLTDSVELIGVTVHQEERRLAVLPLDVLVEEMLLTESMR